MKSFVKPEYISCCSSGRFTCFEKKDRFRTKYVYLFAGHLVTTYVQDCGADLEAENYFEWFLN